MNETDREQLKMAIDEEIVSLQRDIERLSDQVKPVAPDRAIGRLTRMEAINSKSISEANLRTAKARLLRLEQTLDRLDDEEYGICTRCDRPIPIKRMLLVPESTRCVRCMG